MTKKTAFKFIEWKDKNTTRSYGKDQYVIYGPDDNIYTLEGLWRYWVKKFYKLK